MHPLDACLDDRVHRFPVLGVGEHEHVGSSALGRSGFRIGGRPLPPEHHQVEGKDIGAQTAPIAARLPPRNPSSPTIVIPPGLFQDPLQPFTDHDLCVCEHHCCSRVHRYSSPPASRFSICLRGALIPAHRCTLVPFKGQTGADMGGQNPTFARFSCFSPRKGAPSTDGIQLGNSSVGPEGRFCPCSRIRAAPWTSPCYLSAFAPHARSIPQPSASP